ncbi:hypothetical protein D9M68_885720 [compost metagenome]
MPFAKQDRRAGVLHQVVDQREILGLGQVDQPQIGLAGRQGRLIQTGRIAIEYHLIATAGQRLLQHMALQGSVGNDRNACHRVLRHVGVPGPRPTGWRSTSLAMLSSNNDS